MHLGNALRVAAVLAAVVAAAGSATSTSNQPPGGAPPYGQNQPPPPQNMAPENALGLWRSTFGAVKIEPDHAKGGLAAGAVQGIWVYQRQGQEVIGYFSGNLRGNVLQFRWQEPNNPPLTGEGWLVFDPQGRQYSGRWWSDRRDRVGDWNGWRNGTQPQAPYGAQYGAYGGQPYGGQPYGNQPVDPWRSDDYRPGYYGGQSYGGAYGGVGYGGAYQPSTAPQSPW